jgi:hypothetical protein
MARKRPPDRIQDWIDARKRHRLSHAHVQMARELGLNPRKLGRIDNHRQELWKRPLPDFIEDLYHRRFGRDRPHTVRPLEEHAHSAEKKAVRRDERRTANAKEEGAS